jgi:stress response protein YsnF
MSEIDQPETSIPLVQEHVTVDKRVVETGRVRIHSVIDEKLVRVSEELERDDVTIVRVPVNREVTELPRSREENGVLIVPILEEVVVVEKRMMLKEELHIRRDPKRERVEEAVRLRSMRAEIERVLPADSPPNTDHDNSVEPRPNPRRPKLRRKAPVTETPK